MLYRSRHLLPLIAAVGNHEALARAIRESFKDIQRMDQEGAKHEHIQDIVMQHMQS